MCEGVLDPAHEGHSCEMAYGDTYFGIVAEIT